MKKDWENQTNDEIRTAQIEMHQKYESIKREMAILANKVNGMAKQLNEMDADYLESKKVLDQRLKY